MSQQLRTSLSLAVAFGLAFLAPPAHALTVSPDGRTAALDVMTYNLWGVPFAGKRRKERLPVAAAAIARSDLDIVALEEVFDGCFSPAESKLMLKGTRYPYFVRGPKRAFLFPCVSSGVLLLSKHPIVDSDQIIYKKCAGNDCMARKGMVYARIRVPVIGDIDVYSTHMNAEDRFGATRVKQAHQIIAFVKKHSGDGRRPVLFMGDLNATEYAEEVQLLKKELSVRDAYREYASTQPASFDRDGFTIDASRNGNVPADQNPKRIDYVFFREASASPTAAPVSVESASLAFEAPAVAGLPLSDHFAVKSRLVFSRAP
ncbi:MAG: sphingomyelin phosphodiesterase [Bdellovibrionales bacterium]|nr:sphingomyelin phosphodiesterase [Bdellovibrionales bacterium]